MKKQRKINRLRGFDYSSEGFYFVTICVKGKTPWFGCITAGKMKLSKWGALANQCWREIPTHFSNIKLDEYMIMPNHIHGIIIIENNPYVRVAHVRPVHMHRQNMLLSKAIQGFKSSVTRKINQSKANVNFQWQRSFHDHIIRNDKSLKETREYIKNNPSND